MQQTIDISPPDGVTVVRSESDLSITWPRATLRHLPSAIFGPMAVGGGMTILGLLLVPRLWSLAVLLIALMAGVVAIWALVQIQWQVEGDWLVVRRLPIGAKRRWAVHSVIEVKRAAENQGLLVHVSGKGFDEFICPADRQVLEFTAALLSQALAKPAAPAA